MFSVCYYTMFLRSLIRIFDQIRITKNRNSIIFYSSSLWACTLSFDAFPQSITEIVSDREVIVTSHWASRLCNRLIIEIIPGFSRPINSNTFTLMRAFPHTIAHATQGTFSFSFSLVIVIPGTFGLYNKDIMIDFFFRMWELECLSRKDEQEHKSQMLEHFVLEYQMIVVEFNFNIDYWSEEYNFKGFSTFCDDDFFGL